MSLASKKVAIPETRQLDSLARMLEKKGANVIRCPLVSIHDSPDEAAVQTWLEAFIADTPQHFVILTGEGIRRLTAFAERKGLREDWAAALAKTQKIARGPKPGKALRDLSLKADVLAAEPTTAGVIETLKTMDIAGQSLAVQLYGENPNTPLMDYLHSINIEPSCVAPYVYADESENAAVESLIKTMAAGDVDIICFTSQPQLKRLQSVSRQEHLESTLAMALTRTQIAAVGPVVGDVLREQGYHVAVEPKDNFFMGDLVQALESAI